MLIRLTRCEEWVWHKQDVTGDISQHLQQLLR